MSQQLSEIIAPQVELSPIDPPPLENGDRLTRCEFERRYSAMLEVKKAELIERVVYMPSPVHANLMEVNIAESWLGSVPTGRRH